MVMYWLWQPVRLSVLFVTASVMGEKFTWGKKSQSMENPGDLAPEHLTGHASLSVLMKSLMNTKEMVQWKDKRLYSKKPKFPKP